MSNWLDSITEDKYWNESKQSGFSFEDEIDSSQINLDITLPVINKKIETIPKSVVKIESDLKSLNITPNLIIKKSSQTLHKNLNEIINSIIIGDNYYLHHIKSKKDKIKLLDLAIDSCDGDAILTIVLFMKETLNSKLFKHEISNRIEATNQYINYLRQANQWNELVSFLSMLGRSDEAAMVAYCQSIKPKLISSKISNLKKCKDLYCNNLSSNTELKFLHDTIIEQVDLLERQQPIDFEDKKTEDTQLDPTSMFVQVPRSCLINQSVISTLKYCCIYHYNVPNTFYSSPEAIKNSYSLNLKQFTWTCLRAIAICQRWNDVDKLFEAKTLLGGKKLKPIIPFVEIVKILYKNEAPKNSIIKYLSLIEDNETKLNLAKEYKYHNFVLELCVNMKDRQSLMQYLPKIRTNSQEYFYAQDILKSQNIKWKT